MLNEEPTEESGGENSRTQQHEVELTDLTPQARKTLQTLSTSLLAPKHPSHRMAKEEGPSLNKRIKEFHSDTITSTF